MYAYFFLNHRHQAGGLFVKEDRELKILVSL